MKFSLPGSVADDIFYSPVALSQQTLPPLPPPRAKAPPPQRRAKGTAMQRGKSETLRMIA